MVAPDFIIIELANVIWKRKRRGGIDGWEAAALFADVRRLPLRKIGDAELVYSAMEIAISNDRTVYDCLYVALAERLKGVLVTADQRLFNALANSRLSKHIALLGDDLTAR